MVLLATLPLGHLSAQQAPLNAAALFLLFPVGAQAVGMGQTAVAEGGRGEAAFWNPAGLATLDENEFALHSATLIGARTHALAVYFPSRVGVVGGAVYLVDYGETDHTVGSGPPIGRIAYRNVEFLGSYATGLGGSVALGLSYKVVQFRVDCTGDCRDVATALGTTHAVDVGAQFSVGPGGPLRVGVAVRNIGFRLQVRNASQADALPSRVAVGAQYQVQPRATQGAAPEEHLDVKVAADVESPWGDASPSDIRLGVDVGYQSLMRVRAGYAFLQAGLRGPSVGIGVTTGGIGVDLAHTFLTGSDLEVESPTFFSFRLTF